MTIDSLVLLAFTWGGLFWTLGAVVVLFLAFLLILVILIQDSKEGGIGGAFGGGGGDSFLGARAQRGITRFTAMVGALLGVLLLVLGRFNPDTAGERPGDSDALKTVPTTTTSAGGSGSTNETGVSVGPAEGAGSLAPPSATPGAAAAGTTTSGAQTPNAPTSPPPASGGSETPPTGAQTPSGTNPPPPGGN